MNLPPDMAVVSLQAPGGPEALRLGRAPVPQPQSGEVLIRVAAAGVNAPDLMQRRGLYDPPPWHSPLLGLEVSGVVAAIGEGVATWRPGEPVVALCNGGGYAEYVTVPAGQVLPLPPGWEPARAAALPETFFTIMQTLVMRAGLQPGMTVLVHGAAGGIGGAAIMIAGLMGAESIAVVSTEEKANYALSLGATAAIDRTREDIVDRLMALTNGRGAERVIDIAGGETTALNLRATAHGGHIVLIGTLAGRKTELQLGLMLVRQLTMSGSVLRAQSNGTKTEIASKLRQEIWPKLANMPPLKVRSFGLAEAAQAHAALEDPSHYGKIVLLTEFGHGL